MPINISKTPTPLQILALRARFPCVAALAHGLKRAVPKVAALGNWRDVVDYVRQVSALYADRILTQEQSPQLAPTRRAISRFAVHTFAWLPLGVVPRAWPVSLRYCGHSCNRCARSIGTALC
jgi:hypothetical protein